MDDIVRLPPNERGAPDPDRSNFMPADFHAPLSGGATAGRIIMKVRERLRKMVSNGIM
ncbi:hypothetical protein [Rhodopseudomonas palustris]|uniref:hypothetical protein n=1 Tax=Rhodopseudomonas palustris TaxID=1076 RepID=UPI0002DF2D03